MFNVNMKRLALLTLPTWLRRPLAGALIYAGVSPLGRVLHELRVYRSRTRYRLCHNGQVCKLRGVLNDEFDPEHRRIAVEEPEDDGGLGLAWVRDEGRSLIVGNRGTPGAAVVCRRGLGGTGGYDFWVSVPEGLRGSEGRLRAMVNMYKLAGKRFAISYK